MLDGLFLSHMHVFIVLRSLWNCHISFRRQRCFTIDDLLCVHKSMGGGRRDLGEGRHCVRAPLDMDFQLCYHQT